MKALRVHLSLILLATMIAACTDDGLQSDASGTFEARETIISAEVTGTILAFNIAEGQALEHGAVVGYIDSTQLHLRRRQLEAQIASLLAQRPDIDAQLATLRVQLATAEREQERISNLAAGGAATQRQLDDATAQVETLKRRIAAQKSSLSITSRAIEEQVAPLRVQIAQVADQIESCTLISPFDGTVLTKYAEAYEMATPGKPLFKMADLSTMRLRAYITGAQLPHVNLGQKVTVLVDDGAGGYRELSGEITWISDKAEFTPKTIQTRDERANLVYAIKVNVSNDGFLKIGMYGEVEF